MSYCKLLDISCQLLISLIGCLLYDHECRVPNFANLCLFAVTVVYRTPPHSKDLGTGKSKWPTYMPP